MGPPRFRDGLLALGVSVAVLSLGAAVSAHRAQNLYRLTGLAVPALAALLLVAAILRGLRRGTQEKLARPRIRLVLPNGDSGGSLKCGRGGNEVTPPADALSARLSPCDMSVGRFRQVEFNNRVECVYVRDMTELAPARKSQLWWQQEDFDDFLKVRVDIAKAYRLAAKKLGLDVMQVSSVGSHGDEGYRAMIQIMPELAQESRRGLGLGRKRQRAKNRDAYIAAVVCEQARQREEFEGAIGQAGGNSVFGCSAFVPNDAQLARVAAVVSKKDREYAATLARLYYEQDRAAEHGEGGDAEPDKKESPIHRQQSVVAPLTRCESSSSFSALDAMSPMRASGSFCLNDNDEEDGRSPSKAAKRAAQGVYSKGFGLSLEKLADYGLSANGHSLSKYQRLRRLGKLSGTASDDTECGETEDEDDEMREHAMYIAQYRNWRMGGPMRHHGRGYVSEVNTYGSREDYHAWRVWAASVVKGAAPSGEGRMASKGHCKSRPAGGADEEAATDTSPPPAAPEDDDASSGLQRGRRGSSYIGEGLV